MEPTPDQQDTTTEQEMDAAFDLRDQLHAIELQIMRYLDQVTMLGRQAQQIKTQTFDHLYTLEANSDEHRAWRSTGRSAQRLDKMTTAIIEAANKV